MNTPITMDRLKTHLTYSWWKYVLLVILCAVFWNITFAATAPQVPDNQKLEVFVYGFGDSDALTALLDEIREEELPDQHITGSFIASDDAYGQQALSVRVFTGEGELLLLPRTVFQNYAGQGIYEALEEDEALMAMCEAAGADLDRGWRTNVDLGERHLYAVPLAALPEIRSWIYGNDTYFLGIRVGNGNEENARTLLHAILRRGLPAPATPSDLPAA